LLHEQKVRIEVGYGLEPVITAGRAGRILDDDVLPSFKAGDYETGILKGSAAIEKLHPQRNDAGPAGRQTPCVLSRAALRGCWYGWA